MHYPEALVTFSSCNSLIIVCVSPFRKFLYWMHLPTTPPSKTLRSQCAGSTGRSDVNPTRFFHHTSINPEHAPKVPSCTNVTLHIARSHPVLKYYTSTTSSTQLKITSIVCQTSPYCNPHITRCSSAPTRKPQLKHNQNVGRIQKHRPPLACRPSRARPQFQRCHQGT